MDNYYVLYLPLQGITGLVPSNLYSLTALRSLDIDNTYLSGSIPDSISAMTDLTSLILSNNNFAG